MRKSDMQKSRPTTEQLEDRTAPATWGNPWPDAQHLTLSFAPDGTLVGNNSSTLFKDLNQDGSTATWERTVLRAFQTWAVQTNANIGLVADGGQPFGTSGLPEGDPRFGAIRVAAVPMSSTDEMAIASPFDPTLGTWSGNVRFNSNINYGSGTGGVDLFTVALHEAGHSFGLGDQTTDPSSVEYMYYTGTRTGLSTSDIANIQQMYGVRTTDATGGTSDNSTLATATTLNLLTNTDGSLGLQQNGDIASLSDVDVYKFSSPVNLGNLSVRLHVAGLSLLNANLTVYNASGQAIATTQSTDPLNNELVINLPQLLPLGTYYVKVNSATKHVFGVGSYQLQVKALPLIGALTGTLQNVVSGTTTLVNNTLELNGSLLTASLLPPLNKTSTDFSYSYQDSLKSSSDVDYYRIQTPTATPAMQAMVWRTDNSGLIPMATVYNAAGQVVPSTVLVNENGVFVVQVANPTAGATYFVKVQAQSSTSNYTGGYALAITSSNQVIQPTTIAQGTLSASHPQDFGSLTLNVGQLFHFTLAVSTGTTAQAGVRVSIYNSNGTVMTSFLAQNGMPTATDTVYLPQGTYSVRIAGGTPNGSVLPPIQYTLGGIDGTDPQGVQPDDPTSAPSGSTYSAPPSSGTGSSSTPPPSSGSSSSSTPPASSSPSSSPSSTPSSGKPSSSGSSSTSSNYYYSTGGSSTMAPEDPYSNPYSTA
jgi:hypothetical protein